VKRLARIYVADADDKALVEQGRLERGAPAGQSLHHGARGEVAVQRLDAEMLEEGRVAECIRTGQAHQAKSARIIEGEALASFEINHHMIMLGKAAPRMVKGVGFAVGQGKPARHAEVDYQRLAVVEIGQKIFCAPAEPRDAPARQAFGKPVGKWDAQV